MYTEPKPPQNIFQDPISQNISQDPHSQNISQDPISQNISQDPISQNISQDPIPQNISQDHPPNTSPPQPILKPPKPTPIPNPNYTHNPIHKAHLKPKKSSDSNCQKNHEPILHLQNLQSVTLINCKRLRLMYLAELILTAQDLKTLQIVDSLRGKQQFLLDFLQVNY